ncbi:MAG: hypothetical protein ACYDA8_02415 [Deferrisomatales bacterium]
MDTLLSSTVTVAGYRTMEESRDIDRIADFVKQRFEERYMRPMEVETRTKNGFAVMAVSCLMIEALESFYQGWPDTRNKSELAFREFFDRNANFLFIKGYAGEFYKTVRCGILHQAETTGGWHIRREGAIFDQFTRTINATKFIREIGVALDRYCQDLKTSQWEDAIVKNLMRKMAAICNNCEV